MTRSIGPCWRCSLPSGSSRADGPSGRRSATSALVGIGDKGGRPRVLPRIRWPTGFAAHALRALNFGELTHAIHMAAHRGIVFMPHGELDRSDEFTMRH